MLEIMITNAININPILIIMYLFNLLLTIIIIIITFHFTVVAERNTRARTTRASLRHCRLCHRSTEWYECQLAKVN
jgi:hypothetical protein